MLDETSLKIIQNSAQLKHPIRLVVFIKDSASPLVVELARAIKAHCGKIALEIYDLVMDRDKAQHYAIKRVPALVVETGDGQGVTFYGVTQNISLDVLLHAIHGASEKKTWFPDEVKKALSRLTRDVTIRVFIDNNSLQSKFVAETAVGLALGCDRIDADIIVAPDFPELSKKYHVVSLPKTIFGEELHREGAILEADFLSMIFQAEGVQPAPDMKCLVCGKPAHSTICSNCTTRIEAEALKRKIESEKQKAPDTR